MVKIHIQSQSKRWTFIQTNVIWQAQLEYQTGIERKKKKDPPPPPPTTTKTTTKNKHSYDYDDSTTRTIVGSLFPPYIKNIIQNLTYGFRIENTAPYLVLFVSQLVSFFFYFGNVSHFSTVVLLLLIYVYRYFVYIIIRDRVTPSTWS